MNQPKIIILHRLSHRIRVKLSHPLRNVGQAMDMIKEHEGIIDIKYTPITRSVLVYFNPLEVQIEEVIIKIAIAYSKQYNLVPIKLLGNRPKRDMSSLAYYSIGSILIGGIVKFLGFSNGKNIRDFMNWIAVGTTIGAIVEHGYKEINEKGALDPEVVSVMYLINSIGKGNFIGASAISWIATFGRHILDFYYEGVSIQVNEFKNMCTNEKYYDVFIYEGNDMSKKMNFLETFLTTCIEKQNFPYRNNFLMTKEGNYKGILNCAFQNGYSNIRVNGKSGTLFI